MNRTPKIAIDLDGVCANYSEHVVRKWNERTGQNHDYQKQTDFYFSNFGMSRQDFEDIHQEIIQEGLFARLEPVPKAISSLHRLINNEVPICFISNRGMVSPEQTYDWFVTHNLPLQNIYFAKDKALMCRRLGIEWLVDDYVKNIDDVLQVGVKGILFDAPYNRRYKTDNFRVYRAVGWESVLEVINREILKVKL